MIHILLKGRLGNNLFQIAAGASLAKARGVDYCVYSGEGKYGVPEGGGLHHYLQQFKSTILRNVELINDVPSSGNLYEESRFEHCEIPLGDELILSGYFQSEKYFDKELVQSLFSIDNETENYIDKKYGKLFDKPITSIHIRRGDYLANIDIHPICSMSYFRKALERIGINSRFLIISNDIEWCKRQFKGDNFYFSDSETAVVDLYLQTKCTNNIISNSSFSWWGAWLNPNPFKIVIAPTPWFGISAGNINDRDLLPEEWLKLENKMPFYLTIAARLRKAKRDLYQFKLKLISQRLITK